MNPILREIARLRQRVVRVEISRSLLDTATVGVLLAGVAVLLTTLLRRPTFVGVAAGGALLLLSLVIGVVRGMRNGRRTDIFLAKWIDLENKLEDRFASSYEFQAANDPNKFSQACVQTTLNLLAQRNAPLQLPAIAVGGAWWRPLAAVGAVVAGLVIFQLSRPVSATSLDARRRLKVPRAATQAAQKAAEAVAKIQNPQLASVAQKVNQLVNRVQREEAPKEEILSTTAEAEQELRKVQQALGDSDIQVPELANLPPGPIGDLVKALNRKDLDAAIGALQKVAANAGAGALSSAESAALAQVLRQLESSAGRQTPALTGSIDKAVQSLNRGKPGETQAALTALGKELPKARQSFETNKAVRDLIATLDRLKAHAVGGDVPPPVPGATAQGVAQKGAPGTKPAGQPPGGAPGPAGSPGQIPQVPEKGGSDELGVEALANAVTTGVGSGAGDAAGTDARQAGATTAAQGPLQHVTGNYQGKTLKQLVSTSEGGNAGDKAELRKLVATYSEVVQQRLAREEIPAAYAGPVRRYFDQVRLQSER